MIGELITARLFFLYQIQTPSKNIVPSCIAFKSSWGQLLLVLILLFSAYPVSAIPVTIPNAGFEDRETFDALTEGTDKYNQWGAESWRHFDTSSNGGPLRIWNPGVLGVDELIQGIADVAFDGNAAEGKYVVVVRSRYNDPARTFEAATQLLTTTFDSTLSYTLTAKVGRLPAGVDEGGSINYSPSWHGYQLQFVVGGTAIDGAIYAGQVTGGTILAVDDNSQTVPVNGFVTASVSYAANPSASVYDGLPIQIRLVAKEPADISLTGWVAFDDVTLNSTSIAPVAEWHFDESGWGGSTAEVIDSSSTGLHGFSVNGASTIAAGQVCRAAKFDGEDDYLTVTGIDSYLHSTATLSFWMKTSQLGDNNYWRAPGITGIEQAHASNDIFWGYLRADGRLGLGVGGGYHVVSPSSASIVNGTWQHIVLTRDISTLQLQIYINGVLRRSGTGLPNKTLLSFSSIGRIEDTAGTPAYYQGELDEMLIFDSVLSAEDIQSIYSNQLAGNHWDGSVANCGVISLGHFVNDHDNSASYCLGESIMVTAYTSTNTVMSDYVGGITLDTQTGNGSWSIASAHGVLIDGVGDDGLATYTFSSNDYGIATFALSYLEGAESINVDVYDGMIRDDDTEGDLYFSATGFSITTSALSNPPITPINDPIGTQVSAQSFNLHLAAYGTNPNSGECGIIETYTGNKNIAVSASYINPSVGALTISGSGNIVFTNGQAWLSSRYDDVGQIAIVATETDSNIQGSSNHFIVQPDDFSITVSNNPSTTSSGSGFTAAGEEFSVDVKALNALGGVTPNFGNELIPESLTLTIDSLVFPIGGNVGSLSNPSSFIKDGANSSVWVYCTPEFGTCNVPSSATVRYGKNDVYTLIDNVTGSIACTNSVFGNPINVRKQCDYRLDYDTDGSTFQNTTLSWNEVGSITLKTAIADGDYLGSGNITSAASGTVGRFYPDSFFLSSESVSDSCSNFTYLSQPDLSVAYTLSAIASDGNTLTNYDSGLGYLVGAINYHIEQSNDGNDMGSRLSVASADWISGDYTLIDNAASFSRSNSRESPLNNLLLAVSVDDIDDAEINNADVNAATSDDCVASTDCNAATLGSASFYYGRLNLLNAYGPETAALPVKFTTEYWNGQQFVTNIYDDCSALPRGVIQLNANAINSDAALSIDLGGGTSSAQFAVLSASEVGFVSGDAGLRFSAPGIGITNTSFTMHVDLSSIDWLRFDWGQNGNDNDDTALPTATMSFKTYRGHDRILYWRHQ
ncbi:MAG: MSHA biogenesis protein MshQ [Candidatus Endobugula sp.]|jgi:MSHA biogenesis protein MshQ